MKVVAHMANGAEKDITNLRRSPGRIRRWKGATSACSSPTRCGTALTVLVPVVVITDEEHEARRKAIDAIQAIGEVTLEKEEQIREARAL